MLSYKMDFSFVHVAKPGFVKFSHIYNYVNDIGLIMIMSYYVVPTTQNLRMLITRQPAAV